MLDPRVKAHLSKEQWEEKGQTECAGCGEPLGDTQSRYCLKCQQANLSDGVTIPQH